MTNSIKLLVTFVLAVALTGPSFAQEGSGGGSGSGGGGGGSGGGGAGASMLRYDNDVIRRSTMDVNKMAPTAAGAPREGYRLERRPGMNVNRELLNDN